MSKFERLTKLAKERHFASGEHPVAFVMGTCESLVNGRKATREGLFVAGGDRLVFFTKGVFSESSEVFPLATISSVEVGKTMLGHYFRLKVAGRDVEMKWIQKGDVSRFVAFVQSNVGRQYSAVAEDIVPASAGSEKVSLPSGPHLDSPSTQSRPHIQVQHHVPTGRSAMVVASESIRRLLAKAGLAVGVAVGCFVLFTWIGMSQSAVVGWLALALGFTGIAATAIRRPPQLAKMLANRKGIAVSVSLAAILGGGVSLDGAGDEAAGVRAEQEAAKQATAARETTAAVQAQKRSALESTAGSTQSQLLALEQEARNAIDAGDWTGADELRGRIDALVAPYRDQHVEQVLGTSVLSTVAAVLANSDRERSDKAKRTNATLDELAKRAYKAKTANKWADAQVANEEALRAQSSFERIGATALLDPQLVTRTAALAAEIKRHYEEEQAAAAADRAATAKAEELERAYQQAKQLADEYKWADADEMLVNLKTSIDAVDPQLKEYFPRAFSLDKFRKQVERLLGQVRPKAVYSTICGKKPVCGGWDGECVGLESALRTTAHDPDSIDVENCTDPVLMTKGCWVTKCNVRGKNAFGALILARKTFSMSSLGIEEL